jgi:hypothetical protein
VTVFETDRLEALNQELERALDRCRARLASLTAPEALLEEEGPPYTVATRSAAGRWAFELCAHQQPDGSWSGDLSRTGEVLLLLGEMAPLNASAEVMNAVRRATDWIRSRQGEPGRFGDGCAPDRHAAGTCHHYLGGFFSPGPPDRAHTGLRLSCGARIESEADARLAASCLALRALLRWGHRGTNATLHLNMLRRLIAGEPRWLTSGGLEPAARLTAVASLLEANRSGDRPVIEIFLRVLTQAQRADGSWPNADVFQVLQLLEDAAARNFSPELLAPPIRRAVGALVSAQHANGSWGPDTRPRQLLIAIRSLRRLVRQPAGDD